MGVCHPHHSALPPPPAPCIAHLEEWKSPHQITESGRVRWILVHVGRQQPQLCALAMHRQRHETGHGHGSAPERQPLQLAQICGDLANAITCDGNATLCTAEWGEEGAPSALTPAPDPGPNRATPSGPVRSARQCLPIWLLPVLAIERRGSSASSPGVRPGITHHGNPGPQIYTRLVRTRPPVWRSVWLLFLFGAWTVTRSSLGMLHWVAAFCGPVQPMFLLVSFLRWWSPVVDVLGLY